MGLILAESLSIGAAGGLIGLSLAKLFIWKLPQWSAFVRGLPTFGLHWQVTSQGATIALVLGLLAGLMPALAAYRSRIAEMLRQV